MIVLASIYFREFVKYFVPVFTIWVLWGVRGGGQGVGIGGSYPIRLLDIYCIGIGWAVIHIPDDIRRDMVRRSASADKVIVYSCCHLLDFAYHHPMVVYRPENSSVLSSSVRWNSIAGIKL